MVLKLGPLQYVSWEGMTHEMKESKLGCREGYKVRAVMYQQILATWFREWWQSRREELIAMWEIGT